jgi:hypothetical protein
MTGVDPRDIDPAVAVEEDIANDPDVLGVVVTTGPGLDIADVQVVARAEADLEELSQRVRGKLEEHGAGAPAITVLRSAHHDRTAETRSRMELQQVAVVATSRGAAAVVRLRAGDRRQNGSARGALASSPADLAAKATLDAHRQLRGWPTAHGAVVSLGTIGDHTTVTVLVSSGAGPPLLGTALCEGLPLHLAAARATLDALNRGPRPGRGVARGNPPTGTPAPT